MLSLMQTGEGLRGGRGRSRGGWLGGVDSSQPWLSLPWQQAAAEGPAHTWPPGPAVRSCAEGLDGCGSAWPAHPEPSIPGFVLTAHPPLCEQDPGPGGEPAQGLEEGRRGWQRGRGKSSVNPRPAAAPLRPREPGCQPCSAFLHFTALGQWAPSTC
ncbi:hypothetical protein HJG60_011785 [Phyllostomus discolor]|uniref:Uncharacterized protein n=1 Tax=Phyllostomus discolor TaxID=89673 RepID=A0A834DSP5_9CHIR|nr:hypothetical protein HJG60_011785 [Phyllostomus discolor]